MKNKWKNEDITKLFKLVEEYNRKGLPTLESFRNFAQLTGRNALSIRNFYYSFVKELNNNKDLCKELNIDIAKHNVQKFKHFDETNCKKLTDEIDSLLAKGFSVRSACLKLAGGNATEMLRLQNKYRNIKNQTKILKFPAKIGKNLQKNNQKTTFDKNDGKNKLTDDDIKSLFLGLVNLVKENAKEDNMAKFEKNIFEIERENRKKVVELEQKQNQIEMLKQHITKLKEKNKSLHSTLKNYRIDFLNNNQNNDFTAPTKNN